MEGDEFAALVEDIREHGLLEPLWLYEDPKLGMVLLDGRNRLAACKELKIELETRKIGRAHV